MQTQIISINDFLIAILEYWMVWLNTNSYLFLIILVS